MPPKWGKLGLAPSLARQDFYPPDLPEELCIRAPFSSYLPLPTVGEKSPSKQRIKRRRFSSPFSEPRGGTTWISVAVYLLKTTKSQTIEQRLPTRPALEVSFHLTKRLLYLPMKNHISQIDLSGNLGTLARIAT